MKRISQIVLDRNDIRKMAYEYVKSLGNCPEALHNIEIVYNPKENYNEVFLIKVPVILGQ